MFVYSVRGSTIKFFGILGLAAAVLIALIFMLPTTADVTAAAVPSKDNTVNYEKVKTNESRMDFLSQFGWTIDAEPLEEVEIKIPTDFDKIMNAYNEVQKKQGLDLSKYKGKTVNRYTYKVTNYPEYDGTVYANVIVYKNKVIGGDICSSDVSGFIHGFDMPE